MGGEGSIFDCPAHENGGFNKDVGVDGTWNHDCAGVGSSCADVGANKCHCAEGDSMTCSCALAADCPHAVDQGAICYNNEDQGMLKCLTHNAAEGSCDDWHHCENGCQSCAGNAFSQQGAAAGEHPQDVVFGCVDFASVECKYKTAVLAVSATQVRKTPCWPGSWASCSLL